MTRYGCADGEPVHTLWKIEARLSRRPASPSRMEFSEKTVGNDVGRRALVVVVRVLLFFLELFYSGCHRMSSRCNRYLRQIDPAL